MNNFVENREIMSENIKRHLKRLGLNVKEFSQKLDFKYTTVLDWVNGKTYPRIDKIEKMANFFKVEKSDLVEKYQYPKTSSSILQSITETSSKLEKDRQIIVLNTAEQQLDEQNSSVSNQEELFKYDYYDQPASAGTGQYLNDVNKETVELPVNIDADFVIPIFGDSMEPEYHSGDYAFIKTTVNLDDGQVGVFDLKGDAYIKQLIIDGNKACLHSFNKEYKDIPIDEFSDFRIIGKVVGSYSGK